MITVYSKKDCSSCTATKLQLEGAGLEFEVKMLDVDYDIGELADVASSLGMGYLRSFPLIVANGLPYTYSELPSLLRLMKGA